MSSSSVTNPTTPSSKAHITITVPNDLPRLGDYLNPALYCATSDEINKADVYDNLPNQLAMQGGFNTAEQRTAVLILMCTIPGVCAVAWRFFTSNALSAFDVADAVTFIILQLALVFLGVGLILGKSMHAFLSWLLKR